MIIEDDAMLQEWVSYELETEGYEVKTFNDGPTALKSLDVATLPALILLDVQLPNMDGFEICRRLQASPNTATIPVIFLTARTTLDDQAAGFDAGAADYLTKPFSIAELKLRIKAILQRKQKDEARLQATLDTYKESLSHIMNHELLTPMTQIIGSLDMLLEDSPNDPESQQALLQIAKTGSHRLHWLIKGVLLVQQIIQGDVTINRATVNLPYYVNKAIEQLEAKHQRKEIMINITMAQGCIVGMQADYLQQILYQLLDNAYKYSPIQGTIDFIVDQIGLKGIDIQVIDYGRGIDSQYHEKIFDRFYQIDMSSTRPATGIGLGLYIARMLARQYGGDVSVKSKLGQGAIFRFHLPDMNN